MTMKVREQIGNLIKIIPGAKRTYRAAYRACSSVKFSSRKVLFWLQGGTRYKHTFYNPSLTHTLNARPQHSDISDHLGSIFFFALDAKPKLMVELGTRGGESTRVLLAVASITKSTLLSIDIDDCSQLDLPFREHWHFVKADDVEFGKAGFGEWCLSRSIEPKIDVLFLDTSHEYEHTKDEIEIWSTYLSNKGIILFHDTNMKTGTYGRMDGSVDFGWNNERGVMRAIEQFVGCQYDEDSFFCDIRRGYLIKHYPNCNGLTLLKRHEQTIY